MSAGKKTDAARPVHTDVILPMQDPYMAQIINGTKNYEFRKYCLKSRIKRIWFYRTAPHSSITHVCETLPAQTRNPGDKPIDEDGLGNVEFNTRHKDWDGYDFAYKIVSVYELRQPISLEMMRAEFGFKSAPRGLVYLPKEIFNSVNWKQQKLLLEGARRNWRHKDNFREP
ncbi:PUA-like domain-containing protein [Ilyonectria destructans]|nr:PUA-like domain-containing protein [Ilyonectria destructans]